MDKNGLCRYMIVWKGCTETTTDVIGYFTHFIGLGPSRCESMDFCVTMHYCGIYQCTLERLLKFLRQILM